MNKDLEYILNFNENKLFNTKLDDENTDKVKARKDIKQYKKDYEEHLKEMEQACDTARAFDFCRIKYTNTPHQGLQACIKTCLKYSEYLWLLKYTAEQLRKVEQEADGDL